MTADQHTTVPADHLVAALRLVDSGALNVADGDAAFSALPQWQRSAVMFAIARGMVAVGQLTLTDLGRHTMNRLARLYPRPVVVIDPAARFGRPQIRGISTSALADRIRAGEDFGAVADDFELTRHDVILACWCEAVHGPRELRQAWGPWADRAGLLLARPGSDLGDLDEPPT